MQLTSGRSDTSMWLNKVSMDHLNIRTFHLCLCCFKLRKQLVPVPVVDGADEPATLVHDSTRRDAGAIRHVPQRCCRTNRGKLSEPEKDAEARRLLLVSLVHSARCRGRADRFLTNCSIPWLRRGHSEEDLHSEEDFSS